MKDFLGILAKAVMEGDHKQTVQFVNVERRGQPLTLEISFNKTVNLFLSDRSLSIFYEKLLWMFATAE